MSLEKKIVLSFLISSAIIAVFAVSGYLRFVETKREIRFLELSDSIRSKSLLLRRHEKNYFLYGDMKDRNFVHVYLKDLKTILSYNSRLNNTGSLQQLSSKIDEYSARFKHIEELAGIFQKDFVKLQTAHREYSAFFPLVESTFLERPLVSAESIKKVFLIPEGHPAVMTLTSIDSEISALRKNGEEILIASNYLDKSAREKVESTIHSTENAAIIFFPLFFVIGLGTLFAISHNVVQRLNLLTAAIEKTGKGDFASIPVSNKQDEVGVLINTFNKMEGDLKSREDELNRKKDELYQSRKLASIGTLASGVAHELNNPLNNIYLAAQTLSSEIGDESCPKIVRESVTDIFSQTLRVKRIVSDLLEFSREKAPDLREISLTDVIKYILNQMTSTGELAGVTYNLNADEEIRMHADRLLLEQVFINLFTNACDAMENNGMLDIEISRKKNDVEINISDTGKGIQPEKLSRIFDPFFTTKEKGTGLGLAIVYNIINKHHGTIDVKSELGRGTTFKIILPKGT